MRTPEEWLSEMQQQQGQSHCTTHAFIQSIQADASQELSRLRAENQALREALQGVLGDLHKAGLQHTLPLTFAFAKQSLSRLEGGGK